ncbi:hypothetical protein BAVI_04544 [Neobacillus vireti LMG 21834]|uniref:Uncharacterized protein n=1 Tax=Neobacillus vireti LMG 21834 TaxID=1131730 RepID=A0AB94ISK4_9BACI|nr:hypothetical protein BAVI_04544 [Neobacillus vireti LMG 21834]KLT15497.1 hypothetical protein AA980_22870 [Neobacillus vireti]
MLPLSLEWFIVPSEGLFSFKRSQIIFIVPAAGLFLSKRSQLIIHIAHERQKPPGAGTLEGSECPCAWKNAKDGHSERFRVPVRMEKRQRRAL